MIKTIILNAFFILSVSMMAFAGVEANSVEDFGKEKPKGFSLENRTIKQHHSFSLRSGICFKGENLINSNPASDNGCVNYGGTFSIQNPSNGLQLPQQKKTAILSKLTFNPNELLRNYSGK